VIDSAARRNIGGLPGVDRKIRVMVVDDSVVIRRMITRVLEEDPEIEVVGTAANGVFALHKMDELMPDILTLDIEMPEMDGLETLLHLRKNYPRVRVIMFSTLTERGASATIDSLLRGANEYVTKPSNTGQVEESISRLRNVLLPKLKQFYGGGRVKAVDAPHPLRERALPAPEAMARVRPFRAVAIGVSTGGPTALTEVLPTFPADFALPILIVQHMPPLFTQFLAERLNMRSRIRVVEAQHGMTLERGTAYIAPGDYHMRFEGREGQVRIALDQGAPENSCRPAVDAMLRSAAEVFQGGVLAAILTGMGHDGRRGAESIKSRGGYVIAQDSESSVVWGMPGAVVEAGLADRVVGLNAVGPTILREAGRA
jgi:two-component system chemotaxis response regulator CheB